jgi:MerR family transcriptional regulator/heat shock protein HspR
MMADTQQSLFTISNIAKMLEIHPQTLRLYEREGFIKPSRTKGNTRLYSLQDVEQIRLILHLTRHRGVNLAGVEIILSMQGKLRKMQQDIEALQQLLVERMQQHWEDRTRRRALIKTSSRKLVKVP